MTFTRRIITKTLDLLNLQRHNDNYADIEADLTDHEERITVAKDDIDNHKASVTAHAAEHITYSGPVTGAADIKGAVDSVKQQLDTAVFNGDSSVAAAQAAIDADGYDYGNLKVRLDIEHTAVTTQLADIKINVKYPPPPLVGAAGDNLANDTTAIQAVVDYLRDVGGGTIYFPKGVFLLYNYIQHYDSVNFELAPDAEIKRADDSTQTKMFINGIRGRADYATGYSGEGNFTFEGGTINANCYTNPLNGAANGISFFDLGHAENVAFKNTTLKNGENSHYFQISGCRDILLDNLIIKDDSYTSTSGTPDFEAIQIEVLTEEAFPTFGVWDNTPSIDITVQNCVFDNVVRGIGTHSYVPDPLDNTKVAIYCRGIKLLNNTFRNIQDHVFDLWAYDDAVLEGNIIEGNAAGYGIKVYKSKKIRAKNNTIMNTNNSGLYTEDMYDSTFTDNLYINTCQVNNDGTSTVSAIRVAKSGNNVFDDIVQGTIHQYPLYTSETPTGSPNTVRWSRMANGKGSSNNGSINSASADIRNNHTGAQTKVLFNGVLDTAGSTASLPNDIFTFSSINVYANDNGSATNNLIPTKIDKDSLVIGSPIDRFRIITSLTTCLSFSFPDANTIRLDTLTGSVRIRKVVGVM
ncbi:hypothetical protein J2Z22_001582 [Paenibacillus forsythiae]|uniref:Rhamnogalacturonase A/B/Epimerase-like pectate lyase domain-containing protein n=1 Tax=Paenibacillus forsythiae TaxID=365616 RepID=A0ABU3H7S6_9BACL|nr:glycosyl hydrolase family 28-related protein [Paenibacillus forsythiae]MDT3426062.1 hypothetical protein [Paenibacillus forsythiae]